MNASTLLTRRNLRKQRGLLGAIVTLSLLAGLLINLALVMMTQHSNFLAQFAAQTKAAQAVAIVPARPASAQMEEALRGDSRVKQLEVSPGVGILGSIPFADDTMPANFFLYDVDGDQEMNHWEVTSSLVEEADNPIWVPASLQAAGGYELGDELALSSPLGVRKYTVQGFLEAAYGGMQGMGMLWLGLPHEDFAALAAEADAYAAATGSAEVSALPAGGSTLGWVPSKLLSVRADSNVLGRNAIKEAMDTAGLSDQTWEMDQDIIIQSGNLSVGIVSVTVLVFAVMIAAVAVLVLTFMLRGALRDDLPAIGALRAVGCTGRQVIRPLVLPLALLASLSGGLGAGASYVVLPFLSELLRTQTGLTWHPSFSPGVLAAVMSTLGVLIWLSGVLSARKLAKLSTVQALRGGQADHSFSRNILPLGKVHGSLPALIGLKELLAAPGHALLIFIVSAACSLGSVYALAGTGLLSDEERALPLITGGILPQVVALDPSAHNLEETIAAAKQIDGVQTAFYLNQGRLDSAAVGLFAVISDDFDQLPLNPIYEGRYPQHANEIVVGAPVAAFAGLEVGSTWTLTQEGHSQQYLVTGLASSALNAGNFALLTRDGYRQLVPAAKLTNVGIYTKPGVNPEGVKEAMQQMMGSDTQVVNSHRTLQVQVSSFLAMVPLLSYSLVVFAMVVVVLVIGLFTYSLVSRSLPSSGLLKALGFTSRQAASRVRWTVLPPLLAGVIGGGAAGAALIRPLLALTLSGAGIKKVMVPIPLWPSYLVTGFVLATALGVVYAATRPIARVSAQTLLTE